MNLVECPRDAMQGWPNFIPTEKKIAYLNQLLKVGFDVLDFGSFVSPKAIPQLADTKEVLPKLIANERTKLLAIIANTRGAAEAVQFDQVHFLGFPFSISETFQQLNTNKSIAESLIQVEEINRLCAQHGKKMLVYISMGFGNPYGDPYSAEVAIEWFERLAGLGIEHFALADTVGVSNPENIRQIYSSLIPKFPQIAIGAHFHSTPEQTEEKLIAAWESGCQSFDSSINGIGGCPMSKNELVGNLSTEKVIAFADKHQIEISIDREAFAEAQRLAAELFI